MMNRARQTAPLQHPPGLDVSVSNRSEAHPQLDTDESYTLDVSAGKATLTAASVYGALRGLETFSQLVIFNFTTRTYEIHGAPWHIEDSPRFAYRGLMVDTARHYIALPELREIVDAMSYSKMNVLHWHHEGRSGGHSWQGLVSVSLPLLFV